MIDMATYEMIDMAAYNEAKLEAILNPPEEGECRAIGNCWFMWDKGVWKYPTSPRMQKLVKERANESHD